MHFYAVKWFQELLSNISNHSCVQIIYIKQNRK